MQIDFTTAELISFSLDRTVEDSDAAAIEGIDLTQVADFALTVKVGDGLLGYDVVTIKKSGECDFTFKEMGKRPITWRRAKFQLSNKVVADLAALLNKVHYVRLKRLYAGNVEDGVQVGIDLWLGEHHKEVFCSNYFPGEVLKIHGFIKTHVIDEHDGAISKAAVIDPPEDNGR